MLFCNYSIWTRVIVLGKFLQYIKYFSYSLNIFEEYSFLLLYDYKSIIKVLYN